MPKPIAVPSALLQPAREMWAQYRAKRMDVNVPWHLRLPVSYGKRARHVEPTQSS